MKTRMPLSPFGTDYPEPLRLSHFHEHTQKYCMEVKTNLIAVSPFLNCAIMATWGVNIDTVQTAIKASEGAKQEMAAVVCSSSDTRCVRKGNASSTKLGRATVVVAEGRDIPHSRRLRELVLRMSCKVESSVVKIDFGSVKETIDEC